MCLTWRVCPVVSLLVKVKVAQFCSAVCDSMDCTVHGILQARILERVSLSLLLGIFPTQGSNPGPPYCRLILYQLSYQRGAVNKCRDPLHMSRHCAVAVRTPQREVAEETVFSVVWVSQCSVGITWLTAGSNPSRSFLGNSDFLVIGVT